MMRHTTHDYGCTALTLAVRGNHVEATRVLLNHPRADPVVMMMYTDGGGVSVLMYAAHSGADTMRLLLDHPSADPAAMLAAADEQGGTTFLHAAQHGHTDVMRLILDHPSVDPAAMMVLTTSLGWSPLILSAQNGKVDAMRLLLDHPCADPGAMMMHSNKLGATAIMRAAETGFADAVRVLLDHPSADPAAMVAARTSGGWSALMFAAGFAAGQRDFGESPPCSCAPLLLLLRRIAVVPKPSDAHQAHMTEVLEEFCHGPLSNEMFGSDQPDDARDECVRLILERGARVARADSPVVSRIIRELAQQPLMP
jgi:hypothetical protein